jgi:hypothetical protein
VIKKKGNYNILKNSHKSPEIATYIDISNGARKQRPRQQYKVINSAPPPPPTPKRKELNSWPDVLKIQ